MVSNRIIQLFSALVAIGARAFAPTFVTGRRNLVLSARRIPSFDPVLVPDETREELFVVGEKCRNQLYFPPIAPEESEFFILDQRDDFCLLENELVPVEECEEAQADVAAPVAWMEAVMESYFGPRLVLAAVAALYGTNFALGASMNEALPASVVTACRMSLACLSLAPFLPKISATLLSRCVFAGCCTATGYVAQSLALVDTDPARVSFLGAATVLWIPVLEQVVDQRNMGWRSAPQTWIAGFMCITGVGVLELVGASGAASSFSGDALSLLQAVGFGTGCFLSAKLVKEEPDQVLSVTAVMVAVTAILSWVWCLLAGTGVPDDLLSDPVMQPVVAAVLWTGLVSTSLNFCVEISALRKVPASEASVLLATEPVWAAIFAALLLEAVVGTSDYIGGGLIVGACLVNAVVKAEDVHRLTGQQFE